MQTSPFQSLLNRDVLLTGPSRSSSPAVSYSANYGAEGETDDPDIQATRSRQVKNFLLTLFVSRGVPMLMAGDEFRRSQNGNNNAYCQDNEVSWIDWSQVEEHDDLVAFVQALIAFRRAHPVLSRMAYYAEDEVVWFDPSGQPPGWRDANAPNQLGCAIRVAGERKLLLLFNATDEPVSFVLPDAAASLPWVLRFDTSLPTGRPDSDPEASQQEDHVDPSLPIHDRTVTVGRRTSILAEERASAS